MPFPSTSENVALKQAPPTSQQWLVRKNIVGRRENASIINTFHLMQDVVVDKNVEVRIMGKGGMDIDDDCVSDCISLDNFGTAVGYKGHMWNECKKRLHAMKTDEIILFKVDNGWPKVV